MKFKFLLLIFFGFIQTGFSQVVTSIPQFPAENDSIIIYFDAEKGDGGLKGFTGDVYAHTGVITNLSIDGHDWKYVKTDWGVNIPEIKLIKDSVDHYHLVIGKPRSYYGISNSSEVIKKLAFVFRNADGSKSGRDAGGADIFYDLYQNELNVSITSPSEEPYFATLNDSVFIEVHSSFSDNLSLFLNDSLVIQSDSNSISYFAIANSYGKVKIKAVADSSSKSKIDSTYFIVNPPVISQEMPSGIQYGINYISDTSVVLSLYAPGKQNVYVIGDFTNWEADPNFYMKRTLNTSIYWLQINGLLPGKEYIFQYLVDGNLRIADPYSEKISDPNDKFISNLTYPDLIQYPEEKTTQIASVLQTAQQPYEWQDTTFQKPEKSDLVIYELLIRDFLSSHDFKTLTDTLSYLKNLGINAVELMPVMEFEGNESWGYNPDFLFAVDKYYGPKNDLKKFIDEAHKMGIAVILDIVLNHQYGLSPLVRLYWDAINNRPAANNPWFNTVSPNTVFSFGYDFNHESQATKNYVDRVNKYWIENYNIDGYRFDFTKGLTNTPGDGGSFDQARINILKRMADKLWEVDSTAYIILEHFASNDEEIVLSNYGMMLWGNMNYNYSQAAMGYFDNNGADISWGYYKSRGWQNPFLVSYMESHDEERLMYRNLQFGNSNGSYNIKNLNTALQRIKLASAFFYTIPGPKMIWQFGELGYDVSIEFNGRLGNKPIKWDYFNDPERLKLFKVIKELINLKKNYSVFKNGNYTVNLNASLKRIIIADTSMDVSIIGNFNLSPQNITPGFSGTGYWYDYFSGDSILVTSISEVFALAPGEFHIFTNKKLPTPEQGLLTDIKEDHNSEIISDFRLYQNYPNPFNPSTMIRYSIPNIETQHAAFVQLKIYDILGRLIATLVNQKQSAGNYEVEFNASNPTNGTSLASGIYFYTLSAGSFIQTKKMILLR